MAAISPRSRVFVQYATVIVFLAAANFVLYMGQKFFPDQIPTLFRSWEGYVIMSGAATILGFIMSRLLVPLSAIKPQVSMIAAAGWATLTTFFMGAVIFTVEHLSLFAGYALQPFPYLSLGETLFLLLFIVWFFFFLFFAWIGFMRLRRTMP